MCSAASQIINHVLKWIKAVNGMKMLPIMSSQLNFLLVMFSANFSSIYYQSFVSSLSQSTGLSSLSMMLSIPLPSLSIRELHISKKEGNALKQRSPEYYTLYLGPPCFYNNASSMNIEQLTLNKLLCTIILFNCSYSSSESIIYPFLEMWKQRLNEINYLSILSVENPGLLKQKIQVYSFLCKKAASFKF